MILPDLALVAHFATAGDQPIGDVVRDGFSLQRGSKQPSLTGLVADPGLLTATVENFDRRFDPTNTASPYYPDVVPGVPVSLVATWDGTDYPLFLGRVDGWPQTYGVAGLDQIIKLTVRDAVATLALAEVPGPLPMQRTGDRITAVLAAIGAPGGSIDPGTAFVPAIGTAGQAAGKAWALIAAAVAAEWGYGWVYVDGNVIFLDRNSLALVPQFTASNATFGDQPSLGELPYDDTEIPYDSDRTVNDADLSYNDHGTQAHAEDLTSQAAPWGKLSWSQNIPMASGALARSYVSHLVHVCKDPTPRFSFLKIKPQDAPDDLWPLVLALDSGQMFTAKKTPIGGGARIERDVFVRSVDHALDAAGEWTTLVYFDDSNLVTVGAHYGDGTVYGDGTLYAF